MKDATIPVLICLAGLAGIVIWVVTFGPIHLFSPETKAVQPVNDLPAVPAPPQKPKAPAKPSIAAHPVIAEEVAVATPPIVPPAPAIPQPPVQGKPLAKPEVPAASQIAIGAEKTSLTTKFGEPTLSATSTRDGHLHETLIYAGDNGRRVTMIHLEDGKIRSAF